MNEPTTPAVPHPQLGGSYVRHPETHELTLVESTAQSTTDTTTASEGDPGEAVSASPATAAHADPAA